MASIDKKALEKRIGFELPQRAFEEVPFRAYFLSNEKELQNKHNFYVNWGYSIIQATFSVYLYLEEPYLENDRINALVKSSNMFVENIIYQKYNLKNFIIKIDNNNYGFFPDIASKLMVLVYLGHGFERIFRFLKPYFQNYMSEKGKDNSFIIERYAISLNSKAVYKSEKIPYQKNKDIYRCTIVIDDRKAVAVDPVQNNARSKAEEAFINKYKSNIDKKLSNQTKNQRPIISEQRKNALFDAINTLHISHSYITIDQLDQVFIHPSFTNDHKMNNNSVLSILGNQILDMLNYEYIYINKPSKIMSFRENELPWKITISDCISDNYLKYLLYSKHNKSNAQKNKMKEEVFRGILAAYWLNYVLRQDRNIAEFAKKYVFLHLGLLDKRNLTDSYKLLQYIGKIHDLKISEPYTIDFNNADKKKTYLSEITVTGSGWLKKESERAFSEKTAVNAASRKLLLQMLEYCSDDEAFFIKNVLEPQPAAPVPPKPSKPAVVPPKPITTPKPPKLPIDNVSFSGVENVLYICKGKRACEKKGHEIIPATGLITKILKYGNTQQIKISINYCRNCNEYFIGYESFKSYQDQYGILLGNYIFENFTSASGFGFDKLAKDSPLSLCGYTVEQKKGLTKNQRRDILEYIMNHDILEKYQITNYLEFFIATHKNMPAAVEKWSEDLDWVNKYKINQQIHVAITKIKKKH